MHGVQRPKQTTPAGDIPEFAELSAVCDGQHVPWGRTPHGFATAHEVEYLLTLFTLFRLIIQMRQQFCLVAQTRKLVSSLTNKPKTY